MQKAKHECQSQIRSRIVVLGLLVLCVAGGYAYAQAATKESPVGWALSLEDVIRLLTGGVPEPEIVKQIERYKVDFELTKETVQKLAGTGAKDKVLAAIKDNVMLIASPMPNENVGGQVTLKGRSTKVPGKHLWVFLHRKGLRVWWPQGGEIEPEESGQWMQAGFVGQPQDAGFQFEIVAMWISDGDNKSMNDHLKTCEEIRSYPGIALPEGSPRAQVTVMRKTAP